MVQEGGRGSPAPCSAQPRTQDGEDISLSFPLSSPRPQSGRRQIQWPHSAVQRCSYLLARLLGNSLGFGTELLHYNFHLLQQQQSCVMAFCHLPCSLCPSLCILLPLELQLQYTIPGFREICLLKASAQNKPALYLASVHLPHKTRTLKVIKPHMTLLRLVNTSFKHLLGTRLCQVPIFKAASTAVLPFSLGR